MPSAALCRADLLKQLAIEPPSQLTVDHGAGIWFGYVPRAQPKQAPKSEGHDGKPQPSSPQLNAARKGPLQMRRALMVVSHETRAPATDREPYRHAAAPLSEADLLPPSPTRAVEFEHLIPYARLLPVLRRELCDQRPGAIDLDRLVQLVAERRLGRQLPRQQTQRWPSRLIIMLDFSPRLMPYQWDMKQLAARLSRILPKTNVSVRIFRGLPAGRWEDWAAWQAPDRHPTQQLLPRPWEAPRAGTPVLLVSDLGLLHAPSSAPAQAWAKFIDTLLQARTKALALVPLGENQLFGPVPGKLPVIRWSADARMRATRVRASADHANATDSKALVQLLRQLSVARRIDPPLLRDLRKANALEPNNAGLEGMLWSRREEVNLEPGGWRASLKPRAAAEYRQHLSHTELIHARERIYIHHQHLMSPINHEEALLAASCVGRAFGGTPALQEQVAGARTYLRRLRTTLADRGRTGGEFEWRIATDLLSRADEDPALWAAYGPEFTAISEAMAQHGVKERPRLLDPAELARQRDRTVTTKVTVVHDVPSGHVLLQAGAPGPRQLSLNATLTADAGGILLDNLSGGPALAVETGGLPAVLFEREEVLSASTPVARRVRTSTASVVIATVDRPRGIAGWARDGDALFVRSQPFGMKSVTWSENDGGLIPQLRKVTTGMDQPRWALTAATLNALGPSDEDAAGAHTPNSVALGIDAAFGVYAQIILDTEYGRATQKLRWIDPGAFLMGSPEDEPGRYDDEGPQHRVTLTDGFWLFDTPCTQAMWEAVMGSNPSRFVSPERPVEQVSWDDAQVFIERINALIPGLSLGLPTEAQWEHACRAGTGTALYAGDIAILGQNNAPALDAIAWYGGNSGVDFELDIGANTSEWPEQQRPHRRAGTRPVGVRQANAWGMHDMLGNVWEWCADGMRTYDAVPAKDPLGPTGVGESRVVRGGSWYSKARNVRSACRYRVDPGDRNDALGFRCARVQAEQ